MKRTLLVALLAIVPMLFSCNKNNEQEDNTLDKTATQQDVKIAAVLDGKFLGSSEGLGTLVNYYEYEFTPFASPKVEKIHVTQGDLVDFYEKVTIFGECKESKYYNDHLSQIDKEYYYSLQDGQLVFYQHNDLMYGTAASYGIKYGSATSFILTIITTDVTFNKQ